MTDDTLFETFDLTTHLTLRNRVVLAPMTRVSAAADGSVPPRIADYYRVFAHGGFAALITEGVFIDKTYSPGYVNQPGLVSDENVSAWREVTTAVHEEGAVIFAQLMHAGPQSQGDVFGFGALGPSATRVPGEQLAMYGQTGPYPEPERASLDQLREVIDAFASAAVRAKEAGFDGVEIHGANGYLLDAFLTDYLNDRDDEYGGSPEARAKLTVDVCAAVRDAVGSDFVVGVRISQAKVSDPHHKWSGGAAEAEAIFRALATVELNFVHTSEHHALASAFEDDPRSLAEFASQFGRTVVIANGHLDTPELATQIINEGHADLVALGKSALSNRDWVRRAAHGHEIAAPFVVSEFGDLATVKDWELVLPSALTHRG